MGKRHIVATPNTEKFIRKEKMIEMVKRNPKKFTVADLQTAVRLSNPTIRRTIEAEGLVELVIWERPARKKNPNRKKMNRHGCFTDDMLKHNFIFS